MDKKIRTSTFLLHGKGDNRGFGYLYGVAHLTDYLPHTKKEYRTEFKLYLREQKFEAESDIDNMALLTLSADELEAVAKAMQHAGHSLQTLVSLAINDKLKDECFVDDEEEGEERQ